MTCLESEAGTVGFIRFQGVRVVPLTSVGHADRFFHILQALVPGRRTSGASTQAGRIMCSGLAASQIGVSFTEKVS